MDPISTTFHAGHRTILQLTEGFCCHEYCSRRSIMKRLSRSRELLTAGIQTAALRCGCSAAASQPAGMQPWKTAASLGLLDVEQVTELGVCRDDSPNPSHCAAPTTLFIKEIWSLPASPPGIRMELQLLPKTSVFNHFSWEIFMACPDTE